MTARKKGVTEVKDDPLSFDQKIGEVPQSPHQVIKNELRIEEMTPDSHDIEKQGKNGNTPSLTLGQATLPQVPDKEEHEFIKRARLKPFDPSTFPPCLKPESFNNDLNTGSFTPSKYTWGGEQKRGILCHVTDSKDIQGHVRKSVDLEFFLGKDVPLPQEIKESLEFLTTNDEVTTQRFWKEQLEMVRQIVSGASDLQKSWENDSPKSWGNYKVSIRTVALIDLLRKYDLGGERWARQFIYGFPIIGNIEQTGVYPREPKVTHPPDINQIWEHNMTRFQLRARASGALNADFLWKEAMTQVEKGWLGPPLPIDQDGNVRTYANNGAVIAFRFGIDQQDKIRSCDDLKYSTTNEYCTVGTPIKLPTWDHLSQIALDIKDTNRPWIFFKLDHASAYKQLPIDPAHAKLAMVALREPATGAWHAFPPRSLLFGAEAAVTHYNCFSRALAVLTNKIFGIPLLSYFDDYGAMSPETIGKPALETVDSFFNILGALINDKKTDLGREVVFLGLLGEFPNRENGMTLAISLQAEKARTWSRMIQKALDLGVIGHKELESLIGRLSFALTSIFGRFGRAMLAILYAKKNAPTYHPLISDRERNALTWWITTLKYLGPRKVRPRSDKADLVIFTDAATSTSIIAAVTISTKQFKIDESLEEILEIETGKHWVTLFDHTSLIYGLEMLALLAKLWQDNKELRGKCVTFHLDNENALKAIIKNNSKVTIITAMTQLIWHRITQLEIIPWFEWVPSNRNISDLPTRRTPVPFKAKKTGKFIRLREVYRVIKAAIAAIEAGRPVDLPNVP